jgi:hypothetical protein
LFLIPECPDFCCLLTTCQHNLMPGSAESEF